MLNNPMDDICDIDWDEINKVLEHFCSTLKSKVTDDQIVFISSNYNDNILNCKYIKESEEI